MNLIWEQRAHIFRYMTKYRIDLGFSAPGNTAQLMRTNRLTAKNEYDFRHISVSRPDGGGIFRLAMDNSCNTLSCAENRRHGDKRFCPVARGSMVPGIFIDWNDNQLRSACFGLRDLAGCVGMI